MANGTSSLSLSPALLEDHRLPAIIIFVISTFGLYCHCFVMLSIQRVLCQNGPFYMLIASQSLGETLTCALFASYYSPMVFFNITSMKLWSPFVGIFLICFLDVVNCSHLVVTVNRLCAICLPTKYGRYFCRRSTLAFIAIIWLVSTVPHIYFDGVLGCGIHYDDSIWGFLFNEEGVCHFVLWSIDFSKQLIIVISIAILDTITVIKVRLTSSKVVITGAKQAIAKRNVEVNFLKQAVGQFLLWIIEMFCYFFLSGLFSSIFMKWLLTTFAWNIMNTTDA
ncbi:hypothetical protein Aduo_016732 [Ancylostoma duodenale]